jgi:hypothetical protein
MPEGERVLVRQAAGAVTKVSVAREISKARPQPLGMQAHLLRMQRTLGNQAVQRMIRSTLAQPGVRVELGPHRKTAQDAESARPVERADAPPEMMSEPSAGLAPRISPVTTKRPHIQTAWYNFDIPFTDYQFDPSLQGIKTAANVVKDTAAAGFEGIVDEIKSLVASGIDWLSDKWETIQNLASSALEGARKSFSSILGIVKNPLGFLADAVMSFDAQALQKAWATFSQLISSAANGFKAMTDGMLQQVNKAWAGINGFGTSLLGRVSGLTDNFVFKKLPDALQSLAFSVINRLKSLWKRINDGWNALFAKVKAWVDAALDTVFNFVRKVLSFGINVVIAGIVEFGKVVLFLKDFFSNPQKYIDILAKRSVQAFDGVEDHFAGLIGQYFGGGEKAATTPGGTTTVHRAPAAGATAAPKRSDTWSEIGHGVLGMMGQKWKAFKANPLAVVLELLRDMVLPIIGNVKDVIQLFQDIKKIVTGPLSAGSLEELWTSVLQILDIPILIYHTVVSILMRSLMVPLIVATFIPHPLVKGIAAAVGYALLGAFVQAEGLNLAQKLLLLKTGVPNDEQKADAYNSVADSLIALAMTAVIIVVMLILHFIANVMKGVYGFVKAKAFGIETKPVSGGETPPGGKVPGDPAEPGLGRKSGPTPEELKSGVRMAKDLPGGGRLKLLQDGSLVICSSPCEAVATRFRRELALPDRDAVSLKDRLAAVAKDEKAAVEAGDTAAEQKAFDEADAINQELEKLRLRRLNAATGVDEGVLKDLIHLAGDDGELVERLLRLARNDATKVKPLLEAGRGDANALARLSKAVEDFPSTAKPTGGNVTDPRFAPFATDADMGHFLQRHSMDHFDFGQVKASNSFFPKGTLPSTIQDKIVEALDFVRRSGDAFPNSSARIYRLGDGLVVQIVRDSGTIVQFFPMEGPGVVSFTREELIAVGKFIGRIP